MDAAPGSETSSPESSDSEHSDSEHSGSEHSDSEPSGSKHSGSDWEDMDDDAQLRLAAETSDLQWVQRLLAQADDPAALAAAADASGWTALSHASGIYRSFDDGGAGAALVKLLLDTYPAAALAQEDDGKIPLHAAAGGGIEENVRLLLAAAPYSAAMQDLRGDTPLDRLVHFCILRRGGNVEAHAYRTARLLLAAPGQQPGRLLQSLSRAGPAALPLYADVVSRHALTTAQWQRIPAPCPGLGPALPAVLERSTAEAALLVARLLQPERRRLQTAALALHRAQAASQTWLPQPLVWRILAACLA